MCVSQHAGRGNGEEAQAGGSSASLLQTEATGSEYDTLGSIPGLPGRARQGMPGESGKTRGNTLDSQGEARNQDPPGDNAGNLPESSLLRGRNRARLVNVTLGLSRVRMAPPCFYFNSLLRHNLHTIQLTHF